MYKTTAAVGALAAGLLVLSAGTASAQGLPQDYLGSAGDVLPGSVTGSLPGYATGPLGSAAHTVCNVGSVAGSAGAPVPGELDSACQFAPALGNSGDLFLLGDYNGSVGELIGGVPYVGSVLKRVVPTESAADAVEGAVGQLPAGSDIGELPVESFLPALPAS